MKNLSNTSKALLLEGARTTGSFAEGYYYVEEQLYANQATELQQFCNWIDQNIGGAGSANIDMLFKAFKNPNDPQLATEAQDLAKKIQRIKSLTQNC